MKITKVKVPRGFKFKIDDKRFDNIVIQLFDLKRKNRNIGHVALRKNINNFYETHSYLDEKYRNKGLGTLLYARAIQWCLENGYKIRSSGYASADAQRVWTSNSIRKHFNVRKLKSKYTAERAGDTWFAYCKR